MARLWLLSLSLAANALAITIPAVPTWPSSGRCTDKSLTIPSWVISNYTVSGGHTTFHVINRASEAGVTGDIDCTSSGCQGNAANDGLRASLTAGENGTVVTLSELWVCGDTSDKYVPVAISQYGAYEDYANLNAGWSSGPMVAPLSLNAPEPIAHPLSRTSLTAH